MPERIQEHPDYAEGYYDAVDTEPLFPGASEAYEAGWRAAHEAMDMLRNAGFSRGPGMRQWTKTTTIEGASDER